MVLIKRFIGDKKEYGLRENQEIPSVKKLSELDINVLLLNPEALKHRLVKIGKVCSRSNESFIRFNALTDNKYNIQRR
jgi:hypothetical protein